MTYTVRFKRGNKPSVAISTFHCESTFQSNIKEEFYKTLWLMGIQVKDYKKYCFKPLQE